jgi:hypothetical protein
MLNTMSWWRGVETRTNLISANLLALGIMAAFQVGTLSVI